MLPQNNKSWHLIWSLTVMVACALQMNLVVVASGAADGYHYPAPELSSSVRYY